MIVVASSTTTTTCFGILRTLISQLSHLPFLVMKAIPIILISDDYSAKVSLQLLKKEYMKGSRRALKSRRLRSAVNYFPNFSVFISISIMIVRLPTLISFSTVMLPSEPLETDQTQNASQN